MRQLRILHLAHDEKFIDQAIRAFERVAPHQNDLWVIAKEPLRFIKSPARVVSALIVLGGCLSKQVTKYDIVIFHSLSGGWLKILSGLPKDKVVIWLGWGFDYYDIIFNSDDKLLLPITKSIYNSFSNGSAAFRTLKGWVKNGLVGGAKDSLIRRVDIFAPVLDIEYDIVKNKIPGGSFPQYASWNYGNLEEDLIRDFIDAKVTGTSVLVGNSAAPSNNHLDAFSLLSNIDIESRKIVVPLSYGNEKYRDIVIQEGQKQFCRSFQPLTSFLPISDYVSLIVSCGFVIMNHIRQQALGNIVIMLYLGAKIFLQENSPTLRFFRSRGAVLYTVQELEREPALLDTLLDEKSQSVNKKIVYDIWSKEVSHTRTLNLLEFACRVKYER